MLIRDGHCVHHEFYMSSIYSLGDLASLGTEQHILRGGAIQVDINSPAHHILDSVRVRMNLL